MLILYFVVVIVEFCWSSKRYEIFFYFLGGHIIVIRFNAIKRPPVVVNNDVANTANYAAALTPNKICSNLKVHLSVISLPPAVPLSAG